MFAVFSVVFQLSSVIAAATLSRDGVKTASITAAELNRLLRSICDNRWQEVKNIPPLKHAIKPTHTINYTSAVWQLINKISHINITNITIPRATLLLWLKETVSDFVIFMETCCDRVSKSIRNVLDTVKTLSEDECYGCAGNTGDGDVWDPNKETAG